MSWEVTVVSRNDASTAEAGLSVHPILVAECVNRLLGTKLLSDGFDETEGRSRTGDGFWFRFDGRGVRGAVKADQECLLFP